MKPPTPPITPPATFPISGPYFRTVLTKNPATFGIILDANEMIELRNSCLSLPSNNFRLISSSRSNYMFLLYGLIFNLAIVRLENLTSTFFQPVDSSRALVKTSPSSLQNTLSSIFLELLPPLFGYFFASSAAFSAANSMNCPSLTKKEVLPKGDIRMVMPVSESILCRQKGVEEPCCKLLPSLFSIGQVMNIQQLTSSALIKERSISYSFAMPKIDPPGIVTSVRWMTLTLGEQYSVSRQMIGPIIASTKQVKPRETLKRSGSLKVSNYAQDYSGDCFGYIIILNQFDQLPRLFRQQQVQQNQDGFQRAFSMQAQQQGCQFSCLSTTQKLRSRWNSLGCCDDIIRDLKPMRTAWDSRIAPHSFIQNLTYSYIFLIRQFTSYLLPNSNPWNSLYSLMVWILMMGIQNLSFFAKENAFLPAIELITVLIALSDVLTAELLMKQISFLAYFSLICIKKFKEFSQKQHLICCFCWKCFAQKDQTGRSLKRKLLSFRNQNLFKKLTEFVRQVQQINSFLFSCYFT